MSKDNRKKIAKICFGCEHLITEPGWEEASKRTLPTMKRAYTSADQIIALKPTWAERVGWLIDRGWVPPDQYKINIEEIEAKARLTVQTELALERDIIKQINEAKIEEAKREVIQEIMDMPHATTHCDIIQALKGDK